MVEENNSSRSIKVHKKQIISMLGKLFTEEAVTE